MGPSKILLIALLLFLSSCSDLKKEERLSSIKALQNSYNEILLELDKAEMDTSQYVTDLERIYRWAFELNDTIDKGLMYKLDSVNLVKSIFEERNAVFNYLTSYIPTKDSALRNLHFDIEHDYGKRESYEDYIRAERESLDSIKAYYDRYVVLQSDLESWGIHYLDVFETVFSEEE